MKLSSDQVREHLERLQGWNIDGNAIRKQYTFDGFASAIAFIVRVGFDAEAADHHPDILLSGYKHVTLTFTTHSEGGLTAKDFAGAEAADRVFGKKT
jgi:4a-hydroxytetrahydrobiopterin dehydratase